MCPEISIFTHCMVRYRYPTKGGKKENKHWKNTFFNFFFLNKLSYGIILFWKGTRILRYGSRNKLAKSELSIGQYFIHNYYKMFDFYSDENVTFTENTDVYFVRSLCAKTQSPYRNTITYRKK